MTVISLKEEALRQIVEGALQHVGESLTATGVKAVVEALVLAEPDDPEPYLSDPILREGLDMLDRLFVRWDARESVGTEIAHAIGVGSEYRFLRALMAAYRASDFVDQDVADARSMSAEALEEALTGGYTPTLIAFDDPPRIEYINADVPHISRRIDERFDLLLDMDTREPIGFTLYGKWSSAISAVPPSQGTETRGHIPDAGKMVAQPHPDTTGLVEAVRGFCDGIDRSTFIDRRIKQLAAKLRNQVVAFQSRQEEGA